MAQLFETLCMMLAFKESHSLAVHYCRLVWDVRSLSHILEWIQTVRFASLNYAVGRSVGCGLFL